jgi:16S rRNA (cytosine967-C5)-methyltransferase
VSPLVGQSFDWILIDAPCSGSGTLRRHPDLIYRLNKSQLISYQKLQRELLSSATKLLKPQGKLIYATCSLFNSENQQQIDGLLATNANLIPYELPDLHKTSFELIPHIYDCDGFYLAALTKTRE